MMDLLDESKIIPLTTDTSEFDESIKLRKDNESITNKLEEYSLLDKNQACGSPIIFKGPVKKRTKLIFFKKRFMYVLENGTVVIQRNSGRIEEQIQLEPSHIIKADKPNRFSIKDPKKGCIGLYGSDDAEAWACILNTLKIHKRQ